MNERQRLPSRRASDVIAFHHDRMDYTAGFSRFADGRLAEIFLNAGKLDSQADTSARDSAIAASLALQAGCPAEDLRAALTRTATGGPAGALAVALDRIAEIAS